MWAARTRRLLCSVLLLAALLAGTRGTLCAEQPAAHVGLPHARVLVLSENAILAPWYETSLNTFRQTMRDTHGWTVSMERVPLNMDRYDDPAQQRAVVQEYAANRKGASPDLVLTLDNAARFALEQRERFFPGVPVVAVALEEYVLQGRSLSPGTSAVFQVPAPGETVGLARELFPDLARLVVVSGTSPISRQIVEDVRGQLAAHDPHLQVEWLTGLPYDQVRERVAALPADAGVLFVLMHRDGAGRRFVSSDVAGALAREAQGPLFVLWGTMIGNGAVGGVVTDAVLEGRLAADRAARLLEGRPAPTGLVEPTPIFDWRAMQRFGLESRDLPPGSIVRHRPPSLWEAYRNEVLITAAAFVFLTLLVAALSLNILRRRRVEARLEQARDALRASHAHLEERVRERTRELAEMKTLLDSAERIGSSGSWQWHLDTDAFTVSRNWLDLHGVEGGALSREELLRLAHPEDASRVVRAFNEALESGRPYELTHRIIRADTGEVRTIQARGEVVRDEAGRATGILGWAQDVTRIKAAEDALRAANRELEAFSYSVSHDLRAPLHSVSGFSSMLQETQQTRLDDEGRDLLRRIVAATGHMDRLIDDILRLSRISRADMRKEPVDVSALAEEVVRGLAEREPGRAVRARVQPGVVAAADRELLRVLLENLLGNAWKYTRDVAEPDVALEAQSLDGETVYTVCDNGAGFDMNYAHKLFAPFQRLHSDSEFQGTGIGLALVQRIVQRHGGRIWAESGPGRGAAFHFTLG